MENLSVVVLAGERPIEQDHQITNPNIFTLIAGVPTIERVINTLSSSQKFSHILVVFNRQIFFLVTPPCARFACLHFVLILL